MKSRIAIILAISGAVLAGCQQRGNSVPGAPAVASADTSPDAAIRAAIQAHLAHNSNLRLESFNTALKKIAFDGDHAQAQVEFHAKSGGGTMELTYTLSKRDGGWSVVESTPGGSNFSHPALDKTQGPSVDGKIGDSSTIFQVLDKFHSGDATPQQGPPPGHPPVAASPKDKQQ